MCIVSYYFNFFLFNVKVHLYSLSNLLTITLNISNVVLIWMSTIFVTIYRVVQPYLDNLWAAIGQNLLDLSRKLNHAYESSTNKFWFDILLTTVFRGTKGGGDFVKQIEFSFSNIVKKTYVMLLIESVNCKHVLTVAWQHLFLQPKIIYLFNYY